MAATGLAAMAAAGIAAGPAQASSGKIYACYSKKTHIMKYSKTGSCAHKISWNKMGPQGPQGAQGAQGAQGPAGAVAGYYGVTSSPTVLTSFSTPSGPIWEAVTDAIVPAAAGSYQIGTADTMRTASANSMLCGAVTSHGHSHGSIVPMFATTPAGGGEVPITDTGLLRAAASSPVLNVCEAFSGTATAEEAGMTGVQVSAGHYQAGVHPAAADKRNIAQYFRKARAAHRSQAK